MKRLGITLAVALIGLGTLALSQSNITGKIDARLLKDLQAKNKVEPEFDVLVQLKAQADLTRIDQTLSFPNKVTAVYQALTTSANESQTELVKWLVAKNIKHRRFFISSTVALFKVDAGTIKLVAARDDVARIFGVYESKLKNPIVPHDKSRLAPETSLESAGATKVWSELGVKGKGIVVASNDTGVDWSHPALVNSYRGTRSGAPADHNYNWYDSIYEDHNSDSSCGYASQAPCDDNSHGTHTTGTMVGFDGGENSIGMAPDSKWIGCRNMEKGVGWTTTYLDCFEYFLAPTAAGEDRFTQGRPELAPHIINNSWGCPDSEGCTGEEYILPLVALKRAGIMVITSAGNDGPGCSTITTQPATLTDLTFVIGAHDHRTGNIASFSSRGPSVLTNQTSPHITAPGVNIRSSVPGGRYQGFFMSGTSMAAPHVSGAVALIWSAVPKLIGKVDETMRLLETTAVPKTSTQTCGGVSGNVSPNNTYGYGLLDAYSAVKMAERIYR
ncbi:MAG: peptidase S8 [Bdellovibrionales bacterium CG10_big_fil_rev_8_21_14_0_10_45_34]|nr:MAG: peptidase S8 [Bdellovibrionales bacterium CG10_big_fil_rev_8_21_14_0_10_45_34]